MNTQLMEYTKTHSWISGMNNSKGLDGHSNYSGGMDKPNWIVSCGRSRDSDLLQESNFDTALERLGGESKHVAIERFGHWGCGWFELILVSPKSEKHVKIAWEISKDLESYPVLDESDFSEREWEYRSVYANGAKNDLAKAISLHFGIKNGKALVNLCYELNMACQSYYGNDSCINIYTGRSPDKRDIDQLKTVMRDIEYNYEKSRTFKALTKALDGIERI